MRSDSEIEASVEQELRKLGVGYEIIRIDPSFADTAEFCEKYGFPIESSANTIVVASKRGPSKYSACIVKASRRLDVNKTVKSLMGVSRASFASAEQTVEITGMMIGGVTAFALPDDLPVYIDSTLFECDYVILGSGSRSSKLKISPDQMRKIPNAQVIEGLSTEPRPKS